MPSAGIRHTKFSFAAEGSDADLVRTSDWNDNHTLEFPVVISSKLHFEDGRIFSSVAGGVISFVNDGSEGEISVVDFHVANAFNHGGVGGAGELGFYGAALQTQQTVADLAALAVTVGTVVAGSNQINLAGLNTILTDQKASIDAQLLLVRTTVNEILTALKLYGLLA